MITSIAGVVTPFAAFGTFSEMTDESAWQAAVGQWTTIGFADLDWGDVVTTQYAHLGVVFPEGDDSITFTTSFVDSWGLQGSSGLNPDDSITVEFVSPMHWIGVDFPGGFQMELYAKDALIYSTELYIEGFVGVISTTPFDRARIFDPFGFVFIDDLHFGGVPAPGALPLLGTLILPRHRRRS